MDADRCFLRLAVDRGLVPPALANECAAQAAPGSAARMLVERARIVPEVAQALMLEAQRLARAQSGTMQSSLVASGVNRGLGPGAGMTQAGGATHASATHAALGDPRTVVGRPGQSAFQPGVQFGRYRLEEELGRGGMGIVWRARQLDLDRDVALKMLVPGRLSDERLRTRFLAEARAVARLNHPHIVSVYDVGELDGVLFFTMEYVEGGSLGSLPLGQPVPAERVLEIGLALAGALECAHQAGIVHRDLKPGNVLLARNGTPRLTDFGIAKDLQAGSITQEGEILGTPAYMSPEQADGRHGTLDGRTDIYALGAILYRLLTGRPPFEAPTPYEVIRKVLASSVVPPRRLGNSCPPEVEAVVLRCLEKDPDQRYADAVELREALDEARMTLLGSTSAQALGGEAGGAGPPRWFWPALLAGLLVLVGIGASVAWWREHVRAENERIERERLLAEQEARAQQTREAAAREARAALDQARTDPRGALARAELAVREAPDVAEVQAALGRLRLDAGNDPQAALQALDAALAADAGLVEARAARGRCLVRLGRDASEVQAEVDRLESGGLLGKAAASELRGELALREGKSTLAVSQLSEAVRRVPDDARLRRRLARALLANHLGEQALEELDHARELDPSSSEEALLRAQVLVQLERPIEARRAAEEALARDPESPEAKRLLGELAPPPPPQPPPQPGGGVAHGPDDPGHQRTHRALTELQQAMARGEPGKRLLELWAEANLEQDATCPSALQARIELGRHLQRYAEVRNDLVRLLKLSRDPLPVLAQVVDVDIEMGRLAEAERELAELRRRARPEDPVPWTLLAELRQRQKRPEEALAAWDKVVEMAPADGELLHERGHALAALGRVEEALRDMQRAVELQGRRPGHYLVVSGDLLVRLERAEEAKAAYEAGLRERLSPQEQAHAREALARLNAPSER